MENDIREDMANLKKWCEAEELRKSSWSNAVLTHKRRRYVKGLNAVRDFSGNSLRVKCVEPEQCEMEVAAFRQAADSLYPTPSEKRFLPASMRDIFEK